MPKVKPRLAHSTTWPQVLALRLEQWAGGVRKEPGPEIEWIAAFLDGPLRLEVAPAG